MSVTSRVVEARAAKGEQLTLGDLREFVATLEKAGAADSTPILALAGWRGRLRNLKASAVRPGDRP